MGSSASNASSGVVVRVDSTGRTNEYTVFRFHGETATDPGRVKGRAA